ncbi:hypothetical protein BDZ45DRAFT_692771 [Acephala macrosclerotiorum]|nr:hypothetical protein BDZ45DRAFT_692771 [Acephala macrosclerotiorum]
MNAIIFVDFGMTASGAECLILAGPDDFSPIQQFSTGKIPTKLAYGQDGRVTSWGSGCGAEHRVKSHFKTFFGEDLRSHEHHSTSRPASEHELEKWIADYLRCLGKSLLDHVCQVGPLSKDGLNARWYLTVPGCWSDSTRLDFQMLADQVFQELLPGSSVTANLTEAQASCEFLVDCLQPRPGTWAITCDIGGATCDTALGVIEGDPADCMAQTYPINGTGARTGSVGTIDDCFARHIAVFLRDTNIEDDPKILAQELMLGAEWERARHAFDGENMTVLSLPPGWRVPVAKKQTKPSTDNALTSAQPKISLDGRQLTIPPEVMRKLFADFLKGVYKEIDHALQRLRSELPRATLPISTIVLSGGGGSMAYLLVALRSRWQAYLVTAPATARVSALATLKGSVRHYLNNARKQYLSQIAVGVYSHFPSVVWIKVRPFQLALHGSTFSPGSTKPFIISFSAQSKSNNIFHERWKA